MPLDAQNPLFIIKAPDGFHNPVGAPAEHVKAPPRNVDRLVVGAVDHYLRNSRESFEERTGFDPDRVARLSFRFRNTVPHRGAGYGRNILNQRSAQENVQGLGTETDRQNGQLPLEGAFEQEEIEAVIERLHDSALLVSRNPVILRVNVGIGPRQQNPVQGRQGRQENPRILQQRENDRYTAASPDCIRIVPDHVFPIAPLVDPGRKSDNRGADLVNHDSRSHLRDGGCM
jgi:hypothetical protein